MWKDYWKSELFFSVAKKELIFFKKNFQKSENVFEEKQKTMKTS